MDDLAGSQRTVTELCVLALIGQVPSHGYAVGAALAEAGFQPVKGGTLYPLLARLEADGAVETAWAAGPAGPARKVYALTRAGDQRLVDQIRAWRASVNATEALLKAYEAEARSHK